MRILVTGGAGYIGTHTVVELYDQGHEVVVVDDLRNSSAKSLQAVEKITGRSVPFFKIDLQDKKQLETVFKKNEFDAVIHFAGLKSVGESVRDPMLYYRNNIVSTLSLCELMQEYGIKKLIFSSSATVYGDSLDLPFNESTEIGKGIINAYGRTKFMIEQILSDIAFSDPEWSIVVLRYFNPVGAHVSGEIGENPNHIPNNVMPYISQVAVGKLKMFHVFGTDYDTADGTAERDYIHVNDVAKGHLAALNYVNSMQGINVFNLGTGKPVSVMQILKAYEKASKKTIPYVLEPRRQGDVQSSYGDVQKAEQVLHWKAQKTIEDACADSWKWQSMHPNGFGE